MKPSASLRRAVLALMLVPLAGCAFRYHDKTTGTDHVWGVGHLAMRADVRTDAPTVVVHSMQTLGLALGVEDGRRSVTFGWTDAQTARVLAEPAALKLSFPSRDLFKLDATNLLPVANPVSSPR